MTEEVQTGRNPIANIADIEKKTIAKSAISAVYLRYLQYLRWGF